MRSIRAGLVMSIVHCLALAWPSLCPLFGAWFLCNVLGSFAHALIVHMLPYATSSHIVFVAICCAFLIFAMPLLMGYCYLFDMLFNAYYALLDCLLDTMLGALSVVEHV